MTKYDVIIAGASFAGLACAKELARLGVSVLVLERRADIRRGIRTTGILVDEIISHINPPMHLCKPINQVRLYSPSLRHIEVSSSKYLFCATDTPDFMQYLTNDAAVAGVTFLFDTAFESAREENGLIIVNNGLASGRFLVGADGAKSRVAETFRLGKNSKFILGAEAEYTGVEIENPNAFYCFLSCEYAPGYIGWIIPGPKVVQVGVATRHSEKPDITKFFRHVSPLLKLNKPEVVERRGGLIPVGGLVKKFYSDKVILVGDAAGIVSPLTAGGIHTALYYGQRLGGLLHGHLHHQEAHPGPILDKEYPRFRLKLAMRAIFNHVPDWAFNAMVASPFSQPVANAAFFLKKRLPRSVSKKGKT